MAKDFNLTDYRWTLSNGEFIKSAPAITMKEYEVSSSSLEASLKYWMDTVVKAGSTLGGGEMGDPYKGLYRGNPIRKYVLPYFASYHHIMRVEYADRSGNIVGDTAKSLASVASVLSPYAAVEKIQGYDGSGAQQYTVTFWLYNTVDPTTDIPKNKSLLDALIISSLPTRLNQVLMMPPSIFSVVIPGIRRSPAAYIANLTVSNEGQLNTAAQFGFSSSGVFKDSDPIIPDAYKVDMVVQELIVESVGIFTGTQGMDAIITTTGNDLELTISDPAKIANARGDSKS